MFYKWLYQKKYYLIGEKSITNPNNLRVYSVSGFYFLFLGLEYLGPLPMKRPWYYKKVPGYRINRDIVMSQSVK